jgi:hypothetical protein
MRRMPPRLTDYPVIKTLANDTKLTAVFPVRLFITHNSYEFLWNLFLLSGVLR